MSKPEVILFHGGGAGNIVTGSLTGVGIKIGKRFSIGLIDVGITQGDDEYRNLDFPIKAESIDFVILTHAHADHFLALPMLKGFRGKIYATTNTFNQGKELLYDAAYNNERSAAEEMGISHDAYRDMLKELEGLRKRTNSSELQRYQQLMIEIEEVKSSALYTVDDVDDIATFFAPVPVYQNFMVADKVWARLVPSTHQDGSVSIELYVGDFDENSVNISFSGDIGPSDSYLYRNHHYEPNCLINYSVMESLHGLEERSQTPEEAYEELHKIIRIALKKRKTVILAGFALDRDAMLVYSINRMIDEKQLSADVYLDSPLAYKELSHYQSDYASKKNVWFKNLGRGPFNTDEIIVVNKYMEHVDTVLDPSPKVIITASAFGEGGRILDYFAHYIQDANAVFVFASWLSPSCSGYNLHNGKQGEDVLVKGTHYTKLCETYQLSGFSAHGYYPEFIQHIERFPYLKGLILNHADYDKKVELAEKLKEEGYEFDIRIPNTYDSEDKAFHRITAEGITEIPVLEGYSIFKDVLKISPM